MSIDRRKIAAEWFYSQVFKDESIRSRVPLPGEKLPPLLRAARSLEGGSYNSWQSRESIFLKQARLLENYEDDYEYSENVLWYYPTYQSLTDQELRGYFSWRTKLRKGDLRKTSLTYAFLYIYELINQIGVADPLDGYRKLQEFKEKYGRLDEKVVFYLNKWLMNYVVYYELAPSVLDGMPQVVFDQCVMALERMQDLDTAQIMQAVKHISPQWLERSKFYNAYREDCDTVMARVLRRVSDHYAARCKSSFTERYFGELKTFQIKLFYDAVFCDPLKKRSCVYTVDEQCVYRCKNGIWTATKRINLPGARGQLNDLLKTVDSVMREEFGYRHPVKREMETKWLIKIIREEARAVLTEKKEAEARKVTIDFSRLDAIRRDAAITQDRLAVEDEVEEPPAEPAPEEKPLEQAGEESGPLSPAEYRLLQCLLYGRDYGWVRTEGYMLSVLLDGINEKLYDEFMDSVLDDSPAVIEDYADALKEMVHP